MSRLWNKSRLRVYIGEDHLAICQMTGHWRPRVLHKERVSFEPGQFFSAISALDAWLLAHPLRGDIECVLGASHVRYLLLPWDAHLVNTEFRNAVANALFVRSFQEEPAKYRVRFSAPHYGKPQLAAFVEAGLIAEFESLALKYGCRISRMEPLLVSVWNRFRQKLKKEQGTVLIAESGRLLILRNDYGNTSDLQLRPYRGEELFGRAQSLSDQAPTRIFAPLHTELATSLPAGWLGLESAEGFSPLGDVAYAYALCGVF